VKGFKVGSLSLLIKMSKKVAFNKYLRNWFFSKVEERMYKDLIVTNPDKRLKKVQEDKYAMGQALIFSIKKAVEEKRISEKTAEGLLSVFLGNIFLGGFYKRRKFIEKFGFKPPMFITISPEGRCNLNCIGCYANSTMGMGKLPYKVFDKIIEDAKELWGANFFVISGGEPLIYRSEGKTLLNIAEKHSDCYFLMYTNGTLITETMAKKLQDVGNITPSISVEGLEKETNERRGKGVFSKTVQAMKNLREVGVPFGISITATNKNAELIVSEEFIDFYFNQEGAIYGWIFHYMPIGRAFTLDLLPTPSQRITLLKKVWEIVKNKKIFIADFWNSGTSSDGCICAARGGGYFYINWDGDVTPCVFIPYAVDNIKEIYNRGERLDVIINSPFFKAIRKWQAEYGYEQERGNTKNWLTPCPIRDHHSELYEIIKVNKVYPINEEAKQALKDEKYREGLIKYGKEVEKLTKEMWKEYQRDEERTKNNN
jgi:MoaA/NifB/PqqE/SkfB family radical SAM enzyme